MFTLHYRKPFYLLLFIIIALGMHFFLSGQEQIPHTIKEAQQALTWKGWVTVVAFVLTFSALVTEIKPPDVIMLTSTGILVIIGILPPRLFLEGFSNDIIVTIAMLCIIVRTLEVNGLLELVGKKVLTTSKNYIRQMLSLTAPVATASAFLNNTPIVLLMSPIVRKWALKNKWAPSKFLLPLSYAAVLGGACTLIGTSTNLVVDGLLRRHMPTAGFSFFELAYVGIPCLIVGLLYILFFGRYFLPERTDPTTSVTEETREFTAEFMVDEECPFANKTIKNMSKRYFPRQRLVQIERHNTVIDSPSPDLVIYVGDRLVFAGDIHQVAELHTITGLRSVADPHFKLNIGSSHFAEVVIPTTSPLIGKTLKQISFRSNYGASVLAVYRQGWRVLGSVSAIVLQSGDTLMLLAGEPWETERYPREFYYIRHHEKLFVFHPWRAVFILFCLAAMVATVIMGIPIFIASLATVFLYVTTRNVSIREAQNSIAWNILLLIACSFALGRAMEITGVAAYFAQILLTVVGDNPYMLVGGILFVTILSTEFMTNNATALILFPIAIQAAHLAGYDTVEATKAIGVTVAIGASCGYAIPTGYQTHMIVYGPGGYKFKDFIRVGIPMDLMIWAIATCIIPMLWPLR